MRGLVSHAMFNLVAGAAAVAGVFLVEQLRDPTSSLRLNLAELADRLREVTP